MNSWIDVFYIAIISAALVLSVMGLWFAAVIPGIDRWNKRFFRGYFIVFMLCCLSGLADMLLTAHPGPKALMFFVFFAECLILSLPMPMLTVYLLHCWGEDMRHSPLLRAVLILLAVYIAALAISPITGIFTYVPADNMFIRGPVYPLLLLPLIAILTLNLAGTIKRREQLSRKTFVSLLIAVSPIILALLVQLFLNVFPLIDISYVLSALSMYGLVLSDQIEQDLRREREIARQQQEIAHQRSSVMVLQMRPHFIYNTLISIYSLCNQDPQKARQVTKDFTDYLRKNFNAVASESPIPFSEELEHTRAYLAVEQAQHRDKLIVDYDTPFTFFRLPPLTLQPIVENAVKHGMNLYAGPLHVSVRTRQTETGVEITVEDDGIGFDLSDESKPHTTLTNIRQRLEMMCGGTMEITPREGGGTIVTIFIPRPKE